MSEASDDIRIQLYEPWMREQVLDLFCAEYGLPRERQDALMQAFYEHPWQAEQCMRIVALHGDRLAGFQSFFAWPYEKDGERIESFQSGNSLVHPDFRGRGVFRRLLCHLDVLRETRRVDCLVGVPIDVSIGSLIRNGWSKVADVRWFVKPLGLLAGLRSLDPERFGLEREPIRVGEEARRPGFTLTCDPGFLDWRRAYSLPELYRCFRHAEGEKEAVFELKLTRRRFLNELTVGRVGTSHREAGFLGRALRELIRAVRAERSISFLSLALNEAHDPELRKALRRAGFFGLSKSFPFLVKDFRVGEDLLRPELWELSRSDVDTW